MYLVCRSHHFSEKSRTYQEENAPKSLKKHTVQCLSTRRVCDEREGKYWQTLSSHRGEFFQKASNSVLKQGPAHAHTLNLGIEEMIMYMELIVLIELAPPRFNSLWGAVWCLPEGRGDGSV